MAISSSCRPLLANSRRPVLDPKARHASELDDSHRHRRRLSGLIDRLPGWRKGGTLWLLRPKSRWARIAAGVALILGGLPVFGLWMLPLGLILVAEDVLAVRRGPARVLDRPEDRWPQWFKKPGAD